MALLALISDQLGAVGYYTAAAVVKKPKKPKPVKRPKKNRGGKDKADQIGTSIEQDKMLAYLEKKNGR